MSRVTSHTAACVPIRNKLCSRASRQTSLLGVQKSWLVFRRTGLGPAEDVPHTPRRHGRPDERRRGAAFATRVHRHRGGPPEPREGGWRRAVRQARRPVAGPGAARRGWREPRHDAVRAAARATGRDPDARGRQGRRARRRPREIRARARLRARRASAEAVRCATTPHSCAHRRARRFETALRCPTRPLTTPRPAPKQTTSWARTSSRGARAAAPGWRPTPRTPTSPSPPPPRCCSSSNTEASSARRTTRKTRWNP